MTRTIAKIVVFASLILALPGELWAACTTPPPGLVSWWAGETNANDSMGNNPGTLGSGVTFSPGEVGLAFNFAGTGAVTAAASASLDVGSGSGFSIECWIRPNDLNTRRPLLEWRDGSNEGVIFSCSDSLCGDNAVGNLFANIVDASGNPHVLYSGLGLLTTISNFQHVALTYDKGSGIGTLYINGTIAAQANLGSFTPQTSYPLSIGESVTGGNLATFSGLMDEISLYGRALNPSEIRSIFAAGHFGKCRPAAPFIVTQPASQTTIVGGNATFSVTAGGTAPLTYQWRFEGNGLSGATNSVLNLGNVQLSDAGNYSVVVANPVGTVTSSNALLTVSTGGCAIASSALASWWPAEGNGADVEGNNPATVNSGVSYSTGQVGQAFNFNGTSGSIQVPASTSLNVGLDNGFSVECWIRPSDLSQRHPIVEWGTGSSIGVHFYVSHSWFGNSGPGNLMANIVEGTSTWHPIYTGPGLLNTNTFQHVALTYDKASGVSKLYLNGAEVASANLGSFTPQTSYPLYLGQRPSDPSVALYGGLMDEVSVYGKTLSQAEIQAIYTAGASGKCQSSAPFIVTQPSNQATVVGASASFNVLAGGSQPLSYQWRLEGNALGGATNRVLSLSNVQSTDAGNYSVVVSNTFGTVTSSNALLTVTTGACASVSAGIVSWWVAEGNGNDVEGNNAATVNSGVSYSAGEVGQAFNFNGSSGTIAIPASGSLNVGLSNGFSIECWIKPNDVSVRHPIAEWNNGSTIGAHFYVSHEWFGSGGPGDLMANIEDTGGGWHPVVSAAGLVNTTNFQHVALTYDKATGVGKLYLNGAVVANANLGSFTPQTDFPLYLGQRPSDGSVALYNGLMDEVSVYAKALSQAEIQAIYAAGALGKCQSSSGPSIVTQPANQATVVGGSASFSVTATGSQPLSYQWRLENNALSGATNTVLNLSNVQFTDAGNYSVVVSNPFGAVTSSNALLTVSTGACVSVPGGIVSWWPAEANGNDLIGSNPATVNSGVSYSAGEVGQTFNFNGTSGAILIPASASLNVGLSNGLTIECWIKPNDVSVRHPIAEWNDGSNIGVHFYVSHEWFGSGGPGDLMANIEDSGGGWHTVVSPAGLINTTSFQHVAVTYDKASGDGKLYLNGAEVASESLGTFTPLTSYPLYLGQRPSDGSVALYSGLMDEVSVYNRALSQAELQAIYAAGAAGKCAPGQGTPPIRASVSNQTSGKMLMPLRVSGGYQLNFAGLPGGSYVIQRAPTVNGPWTPLTTNAVSANGTGTYTDQSALSGSAFYRTVPQ